MKVLLIVLAVIVGLPVYAFIGFLVFVAYTKICDGFDGDWHSDSWRWDWRVDEGTSITFMVFWPMLVAIGIIVLPFVGMNYLINMLIERGE